MNTNDILLGRGRYYYRNPGNVAFRNMVKEQLDKYTFQANRSVKREIIDSLIAKATEQGRLFIVRCLNGDVWCEAHPNLVRSKVSHALRDARNSAKQQEASEKLLKMRDSINCSLKQINISLTRQPITSTTKECSTSSDKIMKKNLLSNSSRFEFPLGIQMSTLEGLQNEYSDDVNHHHNIRQLDETWNEIEHFSVSKKEIESRTKVVKQNNIQYKPFERYVFLITALSVSDDNSGSFSCPLFIHFCRKNNASDEKISTENGSRQRDDQDFLSLVSQLNNSIPTALSPHEFIYSNNILDLSATLSFMDIQISTLDTTFAHSSDDTFLRKGEPPSIPVEIWCQGPV
jgi:hypothetical protein